MLRCVALCCGECLGRRGKGLGKNEDGIVDHVKVTKREEAAGVRAVFVALQWTTLCPCVQCVILCCCILLLSWTKQLGTEKQAIEVVTNQWWHGAIHSTLQKLSEKTKKKKKKRSRGKAGEWICNAGFFILVRTPSLISAHVIRSRCGSRSNDNNDGSARQLRRVVSSDWRAEDGHACEGLTEGQVGAR